MWQFQQMQIVNMFSIKNCSFKFENGRCFVIAGENKDEDSGQKVNGSGKSALLECIYIAISGRSLRKIKYRSIINNDAKEGSVSLVMRNLKTNDTLRLDRILSEKESQQLIITFNNNNVPFTKVDDDGFKYIISKIGIDIEDIQNYFIITRDKYISFLRSGDTAKKELINRFSKADKLDALDKVFKDKLDLKNVMLNEISNEIVGLTAQKELLNTQLNNILNSDFEKQKQDAIILLEKRIEFNGSEIEKLIAENNDHIIDKNLLIAQLEQLNNTDEVEQSNQLLKEIREGIEELNNNLIKLNDDFRNAPQKVQAKTDDIKRLENNYELKKTQIAAKIFTLGQSIEKLEQLYHEFIECPQCHHKFSLKHTDQDVTEVVKEVNAKKNEKCDLSETKEAVQKMIEDLEEDKKKVNQQIIDDRNNIRKLTDQVMNDIKDLETSKTNIERRLKEIEINKVSLQRSVDWSETQIKLTDERVNVLTKDIVQYQKMIEDERTKTQDNKEQELKVQIEEIDEALKIYGESRAQEIEEQERILKWQLDFKMFKSHLANKSISAINIFVNDYLEKIGSNLSILLSGYRLKADKSLKEEITCEVFRNMHSEGEFNKFSGGERGRVDVCSILALQTLINISSESGGLDFLGVDEILDQVDSYGLDLIVNSLQDLNKTIFIITQHQVNELKENIILARKQNGETKIINYA